MANIFKRAATAIKNNLGTALRLTGLPGVSQTGAALELLNKGKQSPKQVVSNASVNVQKSTNMDNKTQTQQNQNDTLNKVTEFVKKNWVYLAAGAVGIYLLYPMLKKKRR